MQEVKVEESDRVFYIDKEKRLILLSYRINSCYYHEDTNTTFKIIKMFGDLLNIKTFGEYNGIVIKDVILKKMKIIVFDEEKNKVKEVDIDTDHPNSRYGYLLTKNPYTLQSCPPELQSQCKNEGCIVSGGRKKKSKKNKINKKNKRKSTRKSRRL
jgi:hypothetical protein